MRRDELIPTPVGRPARTARSRWTTDSVDQLVELWGAGEPFTDIADRLGRTVPQVKNKIQTIRRGDAGDRLPPRRPRPSPASKQFLITLWNEGVPTAEIAATVGISETGVRKHAERMRARQAPVISGAERVRQMISLRQRTLEQWLTENAGSGATLCGAAAELGIGVTRLRTDLDALFEAGAVDRQTVAAMVPGRFSQERRETIRKLALAGRSRSEIARDLDLKPSYVKDILKRLRRSGALPAPPAREPFDDARLIVLWNEGVLGADIADEMQVDVKMVWNRVRSLPLKSRPRGRRPRHRSP